MTEKIAVENGQKARDLDLVSGHTAYRRASFIDLYLYMPNFVEIGFIGSTLSKSRPKNAPTR